MKDILTRIGFFLSNVRQNDFNNVYRAKTPRRKEKLTADLRRFSQIRIRTIHRRDAEYAEEIPFAQSGDDDWAKTYSSNLSNVFVCRRLPTNKNLILCALCASAVIFLKEFLSVSICVNLRLIAFDALRYARSDNSKYLCLGFTFLCSLLFLLVSFTMAVGGPVYKVDCDKGETIQTKIDEGKAGDVIEVIGTCNENLVIGKENHIVIGKEMNDITLDGQGAATIDGPDSTLDTIRIRGKGITVRGFTITGGRNGIAIVRGERATIEGNRIYRTDRRAILVGRNSSARIMNNTIQNNPRGGILINSGSRAHIGVSGLPGERVFSPNTIIQNGGTGAILVVRTAEAFIAGNVISGNSSGILVRDNSRAHIGFPDSTVNLGGNKIEGNDLGVSISRSSFARIVGNTISKNDLGIQVLDASHALIASNIISNNSGHGISVRENSSVTLGNDTTTTFFDEPNETIVNNGGFGITCFGGGYVKGRLGTLNGNNGMKSFEEGCIDKLLDGQKTGIKEWMVSSITRYPQSKIQDRQSKTAEGGTLRQVNCEKGETIQNKIDEAKAGDVIKVTGTCNENLVIGQELHDITLDGQGTAAINGRDSTRPTILVQGKQITIQRFTITGGAGGISITRGGRALIDGNIIERTGGTAILIRKNSSASIINNTLKNNQNNGISVKDSSGARIGVLASAGETSFFSNIIIQNGQRGIQVARASEALIAGNTISHNRFRAIYVTDNSRAHIGLPDGTVDLGANTIEGNRGGGIGLFRSSYAKVVGNTIRNNGSMDGIYVSDASHADIAKNIIDNNDRYGISVWENSSVTLGNDKITNFFHESNRTTVNNGIFGIYCVNGIVKGRIGTLNGKRGKMSIQEECVDDLVR